LIEIAVLFFSKLGEIRLLRLFKRKKNLKPAKLSSASRLAALCIEKEHLQHIKDIMGDLATMS